MNWVWVFWGLQISNPLDAPRRGAKYSPSINGAERNGSNARTA
jgi:hypothetical protein